ncbi:hen1 methyltransferase [Xylocopa sonorina]|uniref:hen1 methyltransferase n=1 Tax=Xylocopa sonorina TaxID=1818115 RepID=UPI00403AC12B
MFIVLFPLLYLFGKFVYKNYQANKQKAIDDDRTGTEKQLNISEADYRMRDPDAVQDPGEKSIRFFPPAYVQRYVAVSGVLNSAKYRGKLRKVVDFGCAELDFLVYLKNTDGIEEILCVDIDRTLLEAYKNKASPLVYEYLHTRAAPLVIEICEGSVVHNDKKLEKTDAVICIELIEHLYPDTLTDLPYNIFEFIKPKLAVITTPNADFNVLFPNFSGFRHHDHKFEWTRQQFQDWAENITLRYPDYTVTFDGICKGPEGTEHLGCCTQMAIFHYIGEKDICCSGVEGLFKTVIRYDYPFRIDNRSDEEKILDDATYYIRHLSYQSSDMEEEVPLKKVLHMLGSFHISAEALQTILEDANWTVENRESGPVVLIPPRSTFSDYSTIENSAWNDYSATEDERWDEDEWNGEPGPPINSNRFAEQDSSDIWDNQNWEQEPSIIIPQNNSILQDNTYLFDGANILLDDVSETTRDTEIFERHNEDSSTENLGPIPSVNDLTDSYHDSAPSYSNESAELSDSSFTRKFDDTKEDSFLNVTLGTYVDTMSNVTQKLERTLEIPPYMSISRASTSPDPYLLKAVQMDQHLLNDSMCNQSMSSHWMLNNSFEQGNASMTAAVNLNHSEYKSPLKNHHDSNRLRTIYLNTSYKEIEDSYMKFLNSDASISCFNQDRVQDVYQASEVSQNDYQLQAHLQSNSGLSIASNALIESLPQFTSSPKTEVKVNATGKKRRSLDYKEQEGNSNSSYATEEYQLISPGNNNSLESSNVALSQSNNDVTVSTLSTINLSKLYNKQNNSIYDDNLEINGGNELLNKPNDDTFKGIATSTIAPVLNNAKQTIKKELPETSSTNSGRSEEESETLLVNLTTVNGTESSSSFTTKRSAREDEKLAVPNNTNNIQSINCDTKINRGTNQRSTIKPKSRVEFAHDNNDGKTEPESEPRNARNPADVKSVNSTEISCQYAKGVSKLESTPVPSSRIEGVKDVRPASVLNGEARAECAAENREPKSKNVNSNVVEAVESIELKPSSPETVETPPNSWSPEVMDSGYPNSASAPDMTPECDLSSIAQDDSSDSESPSIAEAPRLEPIDADEVENGDLANNNRDGEGNNMMALELNDLEDLQPLINVLEDDLENENDIYGLENGFPIWLLRILNMANPINVEMHREQRFRNRAAGDDARYVNMERDEGFDSSSDENSDLENNEMEDSVNDASENALMDNVENDNAEDDNESASNSDSGSEQWAARNT